jgi:septal ring factor EnvC (AmiA/AmiB activator)
MKRFGFYSLILAAIVMVSLGCSNEKKRLRQQVAAQVDTLTQLRGSLQARSDSLQNAMTSLSQTRTVLDSVNSQNESFQQRIGRLNSQLKQSKEVNENLRASLDKSLALRDSLTAYYTQAFADSSSLLNRLRANITLADSTIAQRDTLMERIRPWYMKWRHDAHRSFIKVMFGAGKARKPNFPEPDVEAIKGF